MFYLQINIGPLSPIAVTIESVTERSSDYADVRITFLSLRIYSSLFTRYYVLRLRVKRALVARLILLVAIPRYDDPRMGEYQWHLRPGLEYYSDPVNMHKII